MRLQGVSPVTAHNFKEKTLFKVNAYSFNLVPICRGELISDCAYLSLYCTVQWLE